MSRCSTHLADTVGQMHPETLYRVCISLAGELATFTESRKRPPAFPPYRHDDLQATFRPVIAIAAAIAVRRAGAERRANSVAGAAFRHPRRPDHRPHAGCQRHLGAGGEGTGAGRGTTPWLPELVQDRTGRADPRADQRGTARASRCAPCPSRRGSCLTIPERPISNWTAAALIGPRSLVPAASRSTSPAKLPGLEIECWAIRG